MDEPTPPPPGERRSRFAVMTERPVAVTMSFLAIAVFGLVSLGKLPLNLLPDISYPTITVRTEYPGAAPQDVEDRLSKRVQEELSTLSRLARITSVSRAEVSDVVLEFDWKTPIPFAMQDVRERLDSVELPPGAGRPLLLRYDPNLDPILRLALSGPRDLLELRRLAEEEVKRGLEGVEGVAAVRVRGGLEEEIRVSLDPSAIAGLHVAPEEVVARLAEENLNATGGKLEEGDAEYIVRTLNEFREVAEIGELVVSRREGTAVRLKDLARVERGHREREVVTRVDGREAVEVDVYREAGANIVGVARAVRERLFGTDEQRAYVARKGLEFVPPEEESKPPPATPKEAEDREKEREGKRRAARAEYETMTRFLAARLPRECSLLVLSDASTFIRNAIAEVQDSAVVGGILAVAILFLFLRRLSETGIIALSIPVSIVATFAVMHLAGVSLNIMSLGGLALGVGMIVDASIVVLESIARCREEGDGLVQAAVRGTSEVGGAVAATTLTTVAVFFPIVFVEGIAGQIFGDQALTVVASLMVSLAVSLTLIPMLASRRASLGVGAARPSLLEGTNFRRVTRIVPSALSVAGRLLLRLLAFVGVVVLWKGILRGVFALLGLALRPLFFVWERTYEPIARAYPGALDRVLRHPLPVLGGCIALTALAAWRLPHVGAELLPEVHQGEFTAEIGLPVGTPVETTDRLLSPVEAKVRAIPDVDATVLVSGVERTALTTSEEGEHTARLTVRVQPGPDHAAREDAVLARTREILDSLPEVQRLRLRRPTYFSVAPPVEVEVRGQDLAVLARLGREAASALEEIEGLSDVRTSVRRGNPEIRVTFDREKLLRYGLELRAAADLLRDEVLGRVASTFPRREERIDIRVQADEDEIRGLHRLRETIVNPGAPKPIPLKAVAELEVTEGPAEVRRIGNRRAAVVTAAVQGFDLGGLSRRIETRLAGIERPEGYEILLGGQKREMEGALASLRFALWLAIFLVYFVMAAQFESIVQPLLIMLTVPLGLVFVVFALEAFDLPLSVVVFLGLILLAGLVVDNAIVLLDRANQKRRAGMPVHEALVEAAGTRLRPILMTTLTTVLGLLPMTGWLKGIPLLGDLGGGEGSELQTPMAITVVVGLTGSTLLTLFVIPVVYRLVVRDRVRPEAAA
jgi:hydrophobic/amphiphilic exporter-1 (mainly G- bacteria), HAE1 family